MLRALLHSCDDPKGAMEGSLLHALLHSCDNLVNNNGACWILALDGILLIPLVFAVFFYPMPALASIAVLAVLTLAALAAVRVHAHRHPPGV
jgi:hypothetical protein